MNENQDAVMPRRLEQIVKLKSITGIEIANCETCECSCQDHDGDYGEIYCGMTCSKREGPEYDECYLEDQGVDIHAEHDCWTPEFWHSPIFTDMISKEDEEFSKSFNEAYEAFRKAVDAVGA